MVGFWVPVFLSLESRMIGVFFKNPTPVSNFPRVLVGNRLRGEGTGQFNVKGRGAV